MVQNDFAIFDHSLPQRLGVRPRQLCLKTPLQPVDLLLRQRRGILPGDRTSWLLFHIDYPFLR